MGSDIAARVVEGRAFNGGVALAVARSGGVVRVIVTVMAGHPAAALTEGQCGVIAFPSPAPVVAGERVAIVLRWAHGGEECAGAVWMPVATALRCAHVRR
jgi:hypothetical protein